MRYLFTAIPLREAFFIEEHKPDLKIEIVYECTTVLYFGLHALTSVDRPKKNQNRKCEVVVVLQQNHYPRNLKKMIGNIPKNKLI